MNKTLTPVALPLREWCKQASPGRLGHSVDFPEDGFSWETTGKYSVALLGVGLASDLLDMENVRKALYALYIHQKKDKIIDIGNIILSNNERTEAEKIEKIVFILLAQNIFPVIIGRNPLYAYYVYSAVKRTVHRVSFTPVIPFVELGHKEQLLDNKNYQAHIYADTSGKLLNFSPLAYQLYLSNPIDLNNLNTHLHETLRLGVLRENMRLSEPLLRDTDFFMVDIGAVRYSDAQGTLFQSPNGLYAEELCALAHYAGLSDKLRVMALLGFDLEKGNDNGQTEALVAQVIWHLLEARAGRKDETLKQIIENNQKFIVDMGRPGQELIFYHSIYTNRWWMEVAVKQEQAMLIACSEDDYKLACSGETPLRWVWHYQKMNPL